VIELPSQCRPPGRLDLTGKAEIEPEQPVRISLDREVRN